jgi:hypothetical protein
LQRAVIDRIETQARRIKALTYPSRLMIVDELHNQNDVQIHNQAEPCP